MARRTCPSTCESTFRADAIEAVIGITRVGAATVAAVRRRFCLAAASNRRDRHHAEARAWLDVCIAQRVELVSTTWTAYEALSILKSRDGWNAVARLWSLLTESNGVTLVYVTKEIEERAVDLFLRFRDKTWGVVDCANLIVMEDLSCHQALGFDHHFVEASRQRGFDLLP